MVAQRVRLLAALGREVDLLVVGRQIEAVRLDGDGLAVGDVAQALAMADEDELEGPAG